MESKFTVKEKFSYLPILVWDVPAINGNYYRFIWRKKYYIIQKNGKWLFVHTYARKFTADMRALSLNAGYVYINGTFYSKKN